MRGEAGTLLNAGIFGNNPLPSTSPEHDFESRLIGKGVGGVVDGQESSAHRSRISE
ncbi:hypothetical protein ABHN11_29875 [Brevibacillus centrosporus]|uniref:hypothetical protein n=1 Tax=Brevibacillus centrosporus TaxID=54910 RepID=UPI003D1DC1F5